MALERIKKVMMMLQRLDSISFLLLFLFVCYFCECLHGMSEGKGKNNIWIIILSCEQIRRDVLPVERGIVSPLCRRWMSSTNSLAYLGILGRVSKRAADFLPPPTPLRALNPPVAVPVVFFFFFFFVPPVCDAAA